MSIIAMIPLGNPAAAWFALVAAPVIAAYFFRYRAQVREIPALSHWLKIGRPLDVRSTATLLRRLLSLAVQILLIGTMVFCLTNPFPEAPEAHRVAIVIDTSATMQTREIGGNRFALAVTEARKILRGLPPDTQVYLIAAANRPKVLQAKGANAKVTGELLDTLRPVDTDGDIPAAIRAISFLADDPAARAVVISDFAGSTPPSALMGLWHGRAGLSFIPIGTDHADCAITTSWAESNNQHWRIGAACTSRGMAGRSIKARLVTNGKTVATDSITLNDAPQRIEFNVSLPAGSAYEIVLDSGDALAVDDHVFGVLPARANICLVTAGDAPLEQAIRANPTAQFRIVSPAQYYGPGDANVLIVDGPGLPPLQNSEVHLTSLRGCLFINTADPFGFTTTGARVTVAGVTHWRGDHPTLAEIDPSAIQFHKAVSLNSTVPFTPILSAGDVPLISEANTSAIPRIIYWAFSLSDTNLASRLIFPILLWDTIDYLAGDAGMASVHITGRPLSLPDSSMVITDANKQGIYKINTAHGTRSVAVNLLSARGTLALPRDTVISSTTSVFDHLVSEPKLNWRMLIELAIALAAIEWILFHWRVLRIG